MRMKLRYIILFMVLLLIGQLGAQQISASVDKDPVGEGDKFHFTITVSNAKGNIAMPDLKDFNVMSGPNQTSRVQIINGARQETYTLSWLLFPKRKGTFVIKSINRGGGSLTYPPVTVSVIEGMPSTEPLIESQRAVAKDHFGKIYVSNTNPYLGEQIIVTYVIYNSIRGFNPQYDFANTLEGFWKEDLKVEPKWSEKLEAINGRNYQKVVIAKQILFPQKRGELLIEPFDVTGTSGFFRQKRTNFKSNRVVVNVKSLPSSVPESFKGAIGNFDLDFEVDKTQVETNEAFNLKVTISGKGNLNLINELPVVFPNDFEVYDPEIKDRISKTGNGMSGSRTFEYLIIPRHSGVYEIDGIVFSHFSPTTKQYKTKSANDLIIDVQKTPDELLNDGPKIVRKEDIEILDSDIRYISNNISLHKKGSTLFGSSKYIGTMLTPALGFLLFLFIRKRRSDELSDAIGNKRKKAGKEAAKHLALAKKGLNTGDTGSFYQELHSGLSGYLSDRIGLSNSEMDKDTLRNALEKLNANNDTIDSLIIVLNKCEMARYAPSTSAEPTEMLKLGEEIINALEEELT